MSRKLPDYQTIAETIGVKRCSGCSEWPKTHEVNPLREADGGFDERTGILHWSDRRPTRRGIYRFLLRVGQMRSAAIGRPIWEEYYRSQRMVPDLALQIGVQLPRSLGDDDRLALKAMLVNEPSSDLRDEAMRWTSRR